MPLGPGEGQLLCTGYFKVVDVKRIRWSKTIICYFHNFSVFSRLQEHTNPTILMDAKQYALTLLLSLFFKPCVFDNHHTTQ